MPGDQNGQLALAVRRFIISKGLKSPWGRIFSLALIFWLWFWF